MRVWLSPPSLTSEDRLAINSALDSGWVSTTGPALESFEKLLSLRHQSWHSVALSSGTAAIHLSLLSLGVGAGDDVCVSSFTFAASANPIIYCKATPVFIESEPTTWNMCPNFLREAIISRRKVGKKPKAIIVVDLYGMPARWNEIREISREFEIPLIEDSAEALGSRYYDEPCGTLGDIGVLSFNGNKIITTSGGGAFLTPDESQAKKVKFLSTQAREPHVHYEHREVGYNYRLSNILAALGRSQLERLDQIVTSRRNVFRDYVSMFSDVYSIFQPEPTMSKSNRWLSAASFPTKSPPFVYDVVQDLHRLGIEVRPLWKPLHIQPVFSEFPYFGDRFSETLFSSGLCFPSGAGVEPNVIREILDVIKRHI